MHTYYLVLIFQINHPEKQCTFSKDITILKIYSDMIGNQPTHYTENQDHYFIGITISWTQYFTSGSFSTPFQRVASEPLW